MLNMRGGTLISEGLCQDPRFPGVLIHETARVDKHNVYIGEGTVIWHFSHVLFNTTIGRNCTLGQNVMVGPNVTIGSYCKIQNNVSVYDGVTLEDGVFCGPSCVFTNVRYPRSFVSANRNFDKTVVKEGATIGANSTIVCGVTIGRFAFIGAGAVITKDVPDYALVVGVPARQVGWVCVCGNPLVVWYGSRRGAESGSELVCERCNSVYVMRDEQLEPVKINLIIPWRN